MRSHPGVSATFFRTLAEAGVNVEMISTSEIRISRGDPDGHPVRLRSRHCTRPSGWTPTGKRSCTPGRGARSASVRPSDIG
ncbi:MAG: ACT domain-containing protein [Candidatus Nanopelagicales bacterium]